ncbi:hypothetical protein NPIL_281251 [Nephila pilipes]|uniref:Uncharacterized protein n=1 Tax=Nephila pilipes TaxID=299642 RepID=A0A8X6MDM1_NEPPI|nr:hypothetical protein NPIL_281251 [Nephila pilipes]
MQPPKQKFSCWNLKEIGWENFSILNDTVENLLDENPDIPAYLFVKGVLRAARESVPRGQAKRYKPFWNKSLNILGEDGDTPAVGLPSINRRSRIIGNTCPINTHVALGSKNFSLAPAGKTSLL